MESKVVVQEPGHSVTIVVEATSGSTWPEVLGCAISAVKGHYDYLNLIDILDHLNEEYGYLLEEREKQNEETVSIPYDMFVDRVTIDDKLWDSEREAPEGDASASTAVRGTED